MSLLSRETLLKKRPRKTKRVEIPEQFTEFAGQEVILQGMTVNERADFEMSLQGKKKAAGLRVVRERLVVDCLVDEEGNRLLTPDDIKQLGETDAAFIDYLFNEASILCGISKQDEEDLAGN